MEKFSLVQEAQTNNKEALVASNQEMHDHIEAIVNTIDTQTIAEVASELFEKGHILDAVHRAVPIEQVIFLEHDIVDRAQYVNKKHENDSGQIRLNTQRLYNPDSPEKELFDVVRVFIHEQIHAFSDEYTIKNISEEKKKRIIGFAEGIKDKTKNTPAEFSYIELNEGMTELISDYIVKEYFKRTGDIPTNIVESLQKENAKQTYPQGRFYIEGIVSMLSEKYEVPEDTIFKALIRFYFGPEEEYDSFPEWLEKHEPLTAESLKKR
ncbi:MAG: hypothetical protein RI996_454 [Candidatus Parcubacteria bacterium]|jgi:hypothetical protein